MILGVIIVYFLILLGVSRLAAPRSSDFIFFRGGRRSPWYLVAFGMVGASISGVTFVSVPGMIMQSGMTYLHVCAGFILGYAVVAFLLLPVYYRLSLTSIYTVLRPLGDGAYKTGAAFFILSKLAGAGARFYVPCYIIYSIVWEEKFFTLHSSLFTLTVLAMVGLIYLYTRRGGIKSLVWTDTLQTLCMLAALVLIIYKVSALLHPDLGGLDAVAGSFATVLSPSSPFLRDTIGDGFHWGRFLTSFLSGAFIVIVMTGLDQDMMQKNLTCRTLRDAQKDMCTYGLAFLPVNLLFLCLGAMLATLCRQTGAPLPATPDDLLSSFALSGTLGAAVTLLFTLGIVAAAFSSADSALTSLTTCFCVDIRPSSDRRRVHLLMSVAFVVCILLFHALNTTSLIDAVYTLCSYTYGPLLGLFAYALFPLRRHIPLFTIRSSHFTPQGDRLSAFAVVAVCLASPLLTALVAHYSPMLLGYRFGYELLLVNGLFTYLGLLALDIRARRRGMTVRH